jgi:hypothetical protein
MNLSITGIYRRIHTVHLTNFRGSIEDFFFGKIYLEGTQGMDVFHTLSKEETGVLSDLLLSSCYRDCFFVSGHSNLHVNDCGDIPGGDVHTHDSEKVRNQHQNVLIHHLVGS